MRVYDHGELVRDETRKNRITANGLNMLRDYVAGTVSIPAKFAIGTGQTTTTAGMTALEAEIFRDDFTRKTLGQARTTFQYQLAASDPASQPVTIGEAGLFTIGGTMFSRVALSPISKTNTVEVTFTWDISFAVGT